MADRLSRVLGSIVLVSTMYWLSVIVALHVLAPEVNPLRVPMSAYVLTAHGHWITSTYFVMAAAIVAAATGLIRTLPRSGLAAAALAFAVLVGAAAIVAGIFPMDFPGPVRTTSGRLHMIGGVIGFPSKVLVVVLFTIVLRRAPRWNRVRTPAALLASGMVISFGLGLVSLYLIGAAGWAQRLLILFELSWLAVVAVHLIHGAAVRPPISGGAWHNLQTHTPETEG